jgi:hypothetical protein
LLEVYFRETKEIISYSVKRSQNAPNTIRLEVGPLSNGELGLLLKMITHPLAKGILDGSVRPSEAGFSEDETECVKSKVLTKEFD